MKEQDTDNLDQRILQHPLIRQLGELAAEIVKLQLMIVYPNASGWSQRHVGVASGAKAAFCRLIQGTEEGAKHCRMCHILMTVAACSDGPLEQRCHAGASVLVTPAVDQSAGALAVLSSCLFAGEGAWKETRARGAKLGADLATLRKAFSDLPRLGTEDRRVAVSIMRALGSAVQEVKRTTELQGQIRTLRQGGRTSVVIEELLRNNGWVRSVAPDGKRENGTPLLIHVVCELIRQRPDLPLSVKELAAAARLTPNHFTSLFHRHTGHIFTEYLSRERLKRAKQQLTDLTLNIGEIARLVGYDDPSYFTRWFRQRTGLSPREWRERGPHPAEVQ
jgi:AraC-like DNA-binding protein